MSFEQIADACSGGKRSDGIPIASPGDVFRIQKEWRKYAGI